MLSMTTLALICNGIGESKLVVTFEIPEQLCKDGGNLGGRYLLTLLPTTIMITTMKDDKPPTKAPTASIQGQNMPCKGKGCLR